MNFIKNKYFRFNQVPIFGNSVRTLNNFLGEIRERKIFFVVFFVFGIQKLAFQYIVFLLNAMTVKAGCIGAGIDFNIDIKQLKFREINNVCSADKCFYVTFFQKK